MRDYRTPNLWLPLFILAGLVLPVLAILGWLLTNYTAVVLYAGFGIAVVVGIWGLVLYLLFRRLDKAHQARLRRAGYAE